MAELEVETDDSGAETGSTIATTEIKSKTDRGLLDKALVGGAKLLEGAFPGVPTGASKVLEKTVFPSEVTTNLSPKVTEQFDTLAQNVPVLNTVAFPASRERDLKSALLNSPNVKIEEALNFENEKVKNNFMNAVSTANSQGEILVFPKVNAKGEPLSFEEKLAMANRHGGVDLAYQIPDGDGFINQTVQIPFENLLAKEIAIPPNLKEFLPSIPLKIPFTNIGVAPNDLQKRAGFDTYNIIFSAGVDPKAIKTSYAYGLNHRLIELGVDSAKDRLGILRYMFEKPDFREFERGKDVVAEGTVRFAVSTVGWFVGEMFDLVDGDLSNNNFDWRSTEFRTGWYDTVVPRHAAKLQDRLMMRGIELDYATAEYISRYFHNKDVYLAALIGEIAGPSKFATGIKKFKAMGMLNEFNEYTKNQLKINKNITEDELISGFMAEAERTFRGPVSYIANTFSDTKIGGFFARINRSKIGNALSNGLQLDDALKNVDDRAEVIASINYKNNLIDELTALKKRINVSGKPPNSKQLDKIDQLEGEIKNVIDNHTFIIAESAVPKFIRDVGTQDNYMAVGAAAMGSIFTEVTTTDPALGEAFGLAGGLIASIFAGNSRAALNYLNEVQFGGTRFFTADSKVGSLFRATGSKGGLLNQAEKLARTMATTSPEFADGIVKRIKYFENLQSELVKMGVDPAVVERGLDKVLGLGVLQMVDHQVRTSISTKSINSLDFKVEELLQVQSMQKELVNELRGALQQLAKVEGINTDGTATNKFQKILAEAIQTGEENVAQINADLTAIKKSNKALILNRIEGNSQGITSHLTDTDHYDIEGVVNRLNNLEIETVNEVKESQIKQVAQETKRLLSNSFKTMANKVKSTLSETTGARLKLDKVMPSNLIAAGAKSSQQSSVPLVDNFKHLIEGFWETMHATAKTNASAPFIMLNKAAYKNADGVFIGANPTIDGGVILDQVFTTLETVGDNSINLLKDMKLSQIDPTKRKNIFTVFENIADDFFSAVAASDIETYPLGASEVVSSLKSKLIDEGYEFQTGAKAPPVKVQIITHLRDSARKRNVNPDDVKVAGKSLLEFNFDTLKEFNSTLKRLSFKEKDANASRQFSAIADSVEKLMKGDFTFEEGAGAFSVVGPNGVRTNVSQLFIEVDGKLVPAIDAIKKANDGWFDYKSIWFDKNNKNSQWMDWANRTPKKVSGFDPLGVARKNTGEKWIDFDAISQMTPTEADGYYQSIQEAFGGKIIEGTDEAEAFKAIIEVGLSEWLVKKVTTNKDVDINEIQTQLQNISNTFFAIDNVGKKVGLIDSKRINDILKYGPNTVPQSIITKNQKKVDLALSLSTTKIETQTLKVKKGMDDALRVLSKYTPQNIKEADIVETMIAGGDFLLTDIRNSLRKLDSSYTNAEIDEVIRTMYIDAIDRKVFRDTGTVEINTLNPNNMAPVLDLDVNTLGDMLGIFDPAKKAVVKKIINGGDPEGKRYTFYENMFKFMQEESVKIEKGLDLTGVPRRFTPEAWISRFYALKRHVISPPYVGTEALLQTMRLNNFSVLRAVLSDPEVGGMFIQMMKTGKALEPERETQFFNALVVGLAKYQTVMGKPETVEMRDKNGRKFEVYIKPGDRLKFYGNLDQYSEFALSEKEEIKKQKLLMIPDENVLLGEIQSFVEKQSNVK